MIKSMYEGRLKVLNLTFMVVVFILMTGCGKKVKMDNSDKPMLTILSKLWSRPMEQVYIIEEILIPFASRRNIRVNMDCNNDFNQNFRKIKIQTLSNNLLIDVIISHSGDMANWIDSGYVESLDPIINKWKKRRIFSDFNRNAVVDGKTYFIPIAADVYLLLANKKALPYLPKGVDLDNITWEEFAQWVLNIKKETGYGRTVFTGVQHKNFIYQFGSCALSYGAGFPDINSKGAMDAWRIFEKMYSAFISSVINTSDCSLPIYSFFPDLGLGKHAQKSQFDIKELFCG
jgi:multiple sugar transport system substrate-binding protein